MSIVLYQCPQCHKIFKLVNTELDLEEGGFILYTDFGDGFRVRYDKDSDTYLTHCIGCNQESEFYKNSMTTDDWIADLMFKVKG